MSPSKLVQLGGLALMSGGVLLVSANLIGIYWNLDPRAPFVVFIVGPAIALVAAPLVVLGLIGLYAHRLEVMGIFGLIAFLITFFGAVMVTGVYWYNTFVAPSVALISPQLFQVLEFQLPELDSPGPYVFGPALSYLLFFLGWFLFGVAILRARLYPRLHAILLIVGSLFCGVSSALNEVIGGAPGISGILPYANAVIYIGFGAIISWLGFALFTGRNLSEDPST